jgi:hypothetical protein
MLVLIPPSLCDVMRMRKRTRDECNITRKHCHESALMTAAHILVRLTQECTSFREIAREHFDDNLELVTVWADYMVGVNWIYPDGGNKWLATDAGKRWLQKIMSPYLHDDI